MIRPCIAILSSAVPLTPPCSLGVNYLTNGGKDMSAVLKLAEVLPSTSITSLKCAPRP